MGTRSKLTHREFEINPISLPTPDLYQVDGVLEVVISQPRDPLYHLQKFYPLPAKPTSLNNVNVCKPIRNAKEMKREKFIRFFFFH